MIVAMRKVTILVSAAGREAALARLRRLGVLHVAAARPPAAGQTHAIEQEIAGVDRALRLLGVAPERAAAPRLAPGEADRLAAQVVALGHEQDELRRELAELEAHERWFADWGEVSLESLETLRAAGVHVRFYVADRRQLAALPPDAAVEVIARTARGVRLVFFARETGARLGELREEPPPPVAAAPLRARLAAIRARLEGLAAQLRDLSPQAGRLLAYRRRLQAELELATVLHGMGQAGPIAYVQGFCPVDAVSAVERAAAEERWACVVQEPDDPKEVPTLIRNPAWVRIIQPVFAFMGTVPGYAEFDISAWFLIFFALFYAILVGDGGYGLLLLAATALVRRRLRDAPPEPFRLLYVLSVATMVWGAITGTWFGTQRIFALPGLSVLGRLVIQPLSSAGGEQSFVMRLCFGIGAVQLSIAHAMNAWRSRREPAAVAQLGWIAIIWSVFFVAGKLVLGRPLPGLASALLIAGVALVLLFANFQRNVVKGALITLGNLPLSVIGSFSDVVSYLRLFAVGFAGFIVARSFNDMAAAASSGAGGPIAGAVILLLGHGINITLALMAVVVHGVRLNMLEFSGHLNMEWSGRPYRPFREVEED